MHKNIIATTLIAALLATSASGFAKGRDHHHDQHGNDVGKHGQKQHKQHKQKRNNRHGDKHADKHAGKRGAGPRHDMHQGGRLPSEYRNQQYVVNDWRGHRLSAPPRGTQWVQAGGDYVLAAAATGVILQILLGN